MDRPWPPPPRIVYLQHAGTGIGDWAPTAANRLPAAASYLRTRGDTRFRAFKLDVLRLVDRRIVEITTVRSVQVPRFRAGSGALNGRVRARPAVAQT